VKRAALVLLVLLGVLAPAIAAAHARPLSYSFWTMRDGGADVELEITTADLAALGFDASTPEGREAAGRFVEQELLLQVGSTPCVPVGPASFAVADTPWAIWRFEVRCSGAGSRRISVGIVNLLSTAHRHLLRLDDGAGHVLDQVLYASRDAWVFDDGFSSSTARGSTLGD